MVTPLHADSDHKYPMPDSHGSTRDAPRLITVILNPASGRGQGQRRRGELERLLMDVSKEAVKRGEAIRCQIMETTSPGEGTTLAAKAVAEGAQVVAAAGGDGTYGEVVNGIVGTEAKLGILPLGTGNDFSRALGLNTDLKRAVETLVSGIPRPLDLGRFGERWFINVAGCGFDAVVAERVNRGFRHLHGTSAYIAAVLQSLWTFRASEMRITLDGEKRTLRAMLCCIANTPSYGGGMRIAPGAQMDDGLFDVCLLGDVGKLEFLLAFPRVFKGTHTTHPKVTLLRARSVRVECAPPLPVLIDGDVYARTPAEFTIVRHAIQVLTPVASDQIGS